MATFSDRKKLQSLPEYQKALKAALGKVKPAPGIPFACYEKFSLGDKETTVFLVDHESKLVTELGKPAGSGKIFVNAKKLFELEVTSGKVHQGKVAKLFRNAGAPLELQLPDGGDDEELPDKPDMTWGYTEWRKWGDDAKSLIAAFDELMQTFRGLPVPKPEWKELLGKHVDLKQDVTEAAKAQITNDRTVRGEHETRLRALTAKARKLGERLAAQKLADEQAAKKPAAPSKPPETPVTKPQATTTAPPSDRPDPEAEKQRLARAAEKQRELELAAERTRLRREAVKAALKLLATERQGFAALDTALREIAKKHTAAKDRAGVEAVAGLLKDMAAAVKKQLSRSAFKKLTPAEDGFDAFEAALKAANDDERVPVAEVNAVIERLDELEGRREEFDDRRAELDPVVRERRSTARLVRGWIYTEVLDEAQRSGTLKDIIGVIGQERRGRTSPNGIANHIHIGGGGGYNVVFHEQGDAVRVLGFVNGHMDRNMSPKVGNEAARVEERARSGNGDFTEVEVNLGTRTLQVV